MSWNFTSLGIFLLKLAFQPYKPNLLKSEICPVMALIAFGTTENWPYMYNNMFYQGFCYDFSMGYTSHIPPHVGIVFATSSKFYILLKI